MKYLASVVILVTFALFATCALSQSDEAKSAEGKGISLLLKNGDHLTATKVYLQDGVFSVVLPYSGKLVVDKEYVLGFAYEEGVASAITEEPSEKDRVGTSKGDVLSGTIDSIGDENLALHPSFAPDSTSRIDLSKLTYCAFGNRKSEPAELTDDMVRVIFLNGDLMTGKIAGFAEGKFTFKPLAGNEFAFPIGQYQAIHNAKESKQFIEGGLAAAIMDLMNKSSSANAYGYNIYVALVRAFIDQDDTDSAVYIFDHLEQNKVQPYMYRQLADEFYRKQYYELAYRAYEKVIASKQDYVDPLRYIECLIKVDKTAEAAAACEQFLADENALTRRGRNPIDIHMKAAELFTEIKDYDKATEHLQAVITDPASKEYKRDDAKQKLIAIYKERGQLDNLIERYKTQLDESEKTIGEGMVLLIGKYIEQGKLTKAKVEFERLKQMEMQEYTAKAEKIILDFENQ